MKAPKLTYEKQQEIFEYWKSHKENNVSRLSEVFGISKHQINKVIDNFLKPIGYGFHSETS